MTITAIERAPRPSPASRRSRPRDRSSSPAPTPGHQPTRRRSASPRRGSSTTSSPGSITGATPASEPARQFPRQLARLREGPPQAARPPHPGRLGSNGVELRRGPRPRNRMASRSPRVQHAAARWRTRGSTGSSPRPTAAPPRGRPDLRRRRHRARSLPLCRRLGIPTVLSMVHGDVREEREVLAREAAERPTSSPALPRRRPARPGRTGLAPMRRSPPRHRVGRILVPSEHIADDPKPGTARPATDLRESPTPPDTGRFRPLPGKRP